MSRQSPSKPLRVAFCHFTADVNGGADICLYNMVKHLPRDRFEPVLILKKGDVMADDYRALNAEVLQFNFTPPRRALEFRKLAKYFVSFCPSLIQTALALRSVHADIVHVNTLYNLQSAFAAKVAGLPLVWHVREMGSDSAPARVMLQFVGAFATRCIAISKAVAGTVPNCDDRLRVVYDGIELDRFQGPFDDARTRASLGVPADVPLVTTVGRIEPWKGQHVLVEAIPGILAECPDARILIVGGPAVNKPEYERGLRERCESLGVAKSVIFTGVRKDIPEIMAASAVIILPSATPEPYGLTVIEAMAAGCPVIATAAGGPLESLADGETGWLVPPKDSTAIAERVTALLKTPGERDRIGAKGRERARTLFDVKRSVSEMADLFEEVARERRGN
jgi:glycosyltransferase involved in cell wall biosynthesis